MHTRSRIEINSCLAKYASAVSEKNKRMAARLITGALASSAILGSGLAASQHISRSLNTLGDNDQSYGALTISPMSSAQALSNVKKRKKRKKRRRVKAAEDMDPISRAIYSVAAGDSGSPMRDWLAGSLSFTPAGVPWLVPGIIAAASVGLAGGYKGTRFLADKLRLVRKKHELQRSEKKFKKLLLGKAAADVGTDTGCSVDERLDNIFYKIAGGDNDSLSLGGYLSQQFDRRGGDKLKRIAKSMLPYVTDTALGITPGVMSSIYATSLLLPAYIAYSKFRDRFKQSPKYLRKAMEERRRHPMTTERSVYVLSRGDENESD